METMGDRRWGLYIDIEGFGQKYDQSMEALLPFNALMSGIFQIGTRVYDYGDNVNRLFAHQFGDGFIIVSCFEENSLDRAAAIAVSLMRHVLSQGGIAKASISEGGFSDIKNCYPKCIVEREKGGVLNMGPGLMTIIPVMGTALINAVGIDKESPSGALLTLSDEHRERLSSEFVVKPIENGLISVNWMLGEPKPVADICSQARFSVGTEAERVEWLERYIKKNKLPPQWVRTTCYEQEVSVSI